MQIRVCRYKNVGVAGYAEAFMPVQSDLQTSEWYSYFENDVLVKRIFAIRFATCLIRLKIWTPGGCFQRTAAPGAVFADDYTLTI